MTDGKEVKHNGIHSSPRILVLTSMFPYPYDPTNGIFIKRQIEAVTKTGLKVHVIRPIPFIPRKTSSYFPKEKWKAYGKMPTRQQMDGIEVYYLRYMVLPFSWFHPISAITQFLSLCQRMGEIIREFHPDIFHSYNATPEGYAGLLVSRKFKLKHVCSLRGSDINFFPFQNSLNFKLTQEVIRKSDQLLAASQALKEKALVIAEPKRNIKVVYNGCNLSMFFRMETSVSVVRKKLGIPEHSPCLIYVGHLKRRKGIFDLIKIFQHLQENDSQIYLIIIGDGEDRRALEREINQTSLRKRIFLMGTLQQETIPDFLSASDVFVLPTYQEGLPNVVLEAMACQLPTVASRVGGIPEIISHQINGIMVEPGDIQGFANALKLLINDKALRLQIGKEALKTIRDKFSWGEGAEELRKIYESLLMENSAIN